MGLVTLPNSLTPGTIEDISKVMANFEVLRDEINGLLDAANIATSGVGTTELATAAVTSPKLAPTTGLVTASGTLSLTGSFQDVAGASLSITPSVASYLLVQAIFNFTTSGSGYVEGVLDVDGSDQTGEARYESTHSGQVNIPQGWRVSLTAAAHTVKLQARQTGGAGGTAVATHTRFLYTLISQ